MSDTPKVTIEVINPVNPTTDRMPIAAQIAPCFDLDRDADLRPHQARGDRSAATLS